MNMAMDYETFKSSNMSVKDMKNIPMKERRELLHRLIEERDSAVSAVLFDAKKGRSVSIFDMADEMGLDACVDFINDLIEKSTGEARGVTGQEFEEMKQRIKDGTASEEDKRLVSIIMNMQRDARMEQFHEHLLAMLGGFMLFSEKEVGYTPTIADIIGSVGCFCTWAMTVSHENQGLSKYGLGNSEAVSEIGIQVGEDIYNAWKATLTEEMDPSFVLTGLMYLATKIARDAGYKVVDIETLAAVFASAACHDCECDCDEGCECCCSDCENENGSNEEDS